MIDSYEQQWLKRKADAIRESKLAIRILRTMKEEARIDPPTAATGKFPFYRKGQVDE